MAIYNEFGYITIDDARIDETCNAYFKWKDLNTYISNNSHRGINMPDAISEPMGCYCMGYLWNRGDEVGDATDPRTGKKIEFKATSRFEGDLSSFGPKCVFDDLVFLRFKLGMRTFSWTINLSVPSRLSCSYKSSALSVLNWTQPSEGKLNSFFCIPMDIFIENFDKLLDSNISP